MDRYNVHCVTRQYYPASSGFFRPVATLQSVVFGLKKLLLAGYTTINESKIE